MRNQATSIALGCQWQRQTTSMDKQVIQCTQPLRLRHRSFFFLLYKFAWNDEFLTRQHQSQPAYGFFSGLLLNFVEVRHIQRVPRLWTGIWNQIDLFTSFHMQKNLRCNFRDSFHSSGLLTCNVCRVWNLYSLLNWLVATPSSSTARQTSNRYSVSSCFLLLIGICVNGEIIGAVIGLDWNPYIWQKINSFRSYNEI
jgi:hypothetical protein